MPQTKKWSVNKWEVSFIVWKDLNQKQKKPDEPSIKVSVYKVKPLLQFTFWWNLNPEYRIKLNNVKPLLFYYDVFSSHSNAERKQSVKAIF